MKFYLTLLRRDGRRLPPDDAGAGRLVTTQIVAHKGTRAVVATCCFGGLVVSELWEPELVAIGDDDVTLRGFERAEGAGLVQEWRLRPHSMAAAP